MERYAKKLKIPAPKSMPNRKNVLNKILWLTGKKTAKSESAAKEKKSAGNSFGTDKKAWIAMYKKQEIKKIKGMRFADPKFFIAPNRPGIYDRCLKIRIIQAIRQKTSMQVEMMGQPVIKGICRIKDSSIKTMIMAYEAASENVLPFMRNKKNAAVHMQKISAETNAAIITFFPFLFGLLFLSDDLLFQS